jgi:hypothetical protein
MHRFAYREDHGLSEKALEVRIEVAAEEQEAEPTASRKRRWRTRAAQW